MKRFAETPTDYARPYRPWPVTAFNALARRTPRSGPTRRLDAEQMLANARKRTGLEDLGDERCLTALRALVRSINDEAELTPTGVLLQRQRIEGALANRLRVAQLLKRHPEIQQLDLGKVVLITGLQRTGTTALHRLVASHPNMRALMSWEALNPAPLPGEGDRGIDRRLRRARLAERTIAFLAPAFFAVHPIDHDAPEEDILLLDLTFMSQTPEATMQVPSYAKWLEGQDHAPAYRYLRTLLQALHWQRPAEHWVLKTPHHLEHLDSALETFPNLTVVQTHRDPQVAVASFLSMVAHGRGVFSDRVDAKAIARHWTAKARRMIERAESVRRQADPARFVDVLYSDLVRDPMAQLERIYRQAGIPFSAEAQAIAARTAQRNPQHRHGKHIYNAAQFGLDRGALRDALASYQARYGIPNEGKPKPTSRRSPGAKVDACDSLVPRSGKQERNRIKSITSALSAAIGQRATERPAIEPVPKSQRIDGKVCLVTGANSGLGKAVAIDLARRGGTVLMACRSGHPEAGEEVKRRSGSSEVRMRKVDLADLASVHRLCDELRDTVPQIHIAVLNAGLMPRRASRSKQGFELMFAVHFLANRVLVDRLLEDGLLKPSDGTNDAPRVVLVSSETHRNAEPIDFDRLGAFVNYPFKDGLKHYGQSKLAQCTFAQALSRRLNPEPQVRIAVHALCPGPINSNIAREAPLLLKLCLRRSCRRFS